MTPPFTVPCEGREARLFTPFPPGIEPRAVAWESITLPQRHAFSMVVSVLYLIGLS